MTSKEAKNIVRGITDKIEATTDIDDWAEFWGFARGDYEEFLKIPIKMLEQEPKWIPVSERLPEDRREVLVTAYWHETYQVMMASYYGDGLWWCVPFNNCGEHTQRLNPKAWMPLPESYEPQERSDKE